MYIKRMCYVAKQSCSILPKAIYYSHTSSCPAKKSSGASGGFGPAKRNEKSGPCRLAFIPEEWFQAFHPITGVSGPYVLGLVSANYIFSKEILVCEHEYYSGLPWIVIICTVVKKFGPAVAASLDRDVDNHCKELESHRTAEKNLYNEIIKESKDSQRRAKGQELLIQAKKENVAMQLEAVYRERMMQVYSSVKGRIEYHAKKQRALNRIHQKWMIGWILENVRKSITPEFQVQALQSAISDLSNAAAKVK